LSRETRFLAYGLTSQYNWLESITRSASSRRILRSPLQDFRLIRSDAPERAQGIAVGAATLNGRENVPLVAKLIDTMLECIAWQVVLVDDDSLDGTARKNPWIRCLQFALVGGVEPPSHSAMNEPRCPRAAFLYPRRSAPRSWRRLRSLFVNNAVANVEIYSLRIRGPEP
jgi:hypothetical protein